MKTRNEPKCIELVEADVPLLVVFLGKRGQQKVYELKPASRKFGLSLQSVSAAVVELVLRRK